MLEIALLGGEGGGAMVANAIRRLAAAGRPVGVAGFLNDALPAGSALCGEKVLGGFDAWRGLGQAIAFLAPLHKAKDIQRRRARVLGLGIPEARWTTVVDPGAYVAEDARLGPGSFAGPFAMVDAGARLGRHVSLWPTAQVGHDCDLADFVFVGRAGIVSGRCKLGEGVHVGPGAVILDGRTIGRFAVVGAGAVVTKDVPDYAIVAGNPAKRIGAVEAA
jgi:acetyltransferase EpsM